MKHCLNSILAVVALVASTACSSSFSRSELTGKHGQIWDVVMMDGKRIAPSAGQTPYLGFRGHEVWGFTGCNRLSGGSLGNDTRVDFSAMACTMMACPDDTCEASFLAALGQAKRAQIVRDSLELTDGAGQVVLRLRRRVSSKQQLAGTWRFSRINGQSLSALRGAKGSDEADASDVPSLSFDVKAAQFSGFTGCNRLLGTLALDDAESGRIGLNVTGSTRMRCDDNQLEQTLLAALRKVVAFSVDGDALSLFDDAGSAILELTKIAESSSEE